MLKASKYQGKDLKTETSSKTKRSQCFEIKILCMFAGEKNKGERQNLNSTLEGNGIVESHIYAHAQLSESNGFQSTVKVENEEGLIHDDGQEKREVKTENGVHLANVYNGIKEKG